MRWGGTGNGSFGVGATAYTLASRDKNSSYYYYQEPLAPVTASSAFGVPRQVHAKKPDKRQGRRIIGSNARSSKGTVEENSSGSLETEPESTPLIMCAGKSFYGTTSDLSCSEDRDNNDSIQQSDDNPRQNNQSPPFRAISAAKTTLMELDSPPRHRTDEELEQIIRELRDQVFQKPNQDLVQVKTLKASVKTDNTANQTQKRPRKHLKNPIEKMEAVVARVPSTTSIESNPIVSNRLQRPLSSSQLNRIMAENTIQIAVPAVIYVAPQATANRVTSNQISSLDFSSLRHKSRPNSSSGCLTREKQSLNPRHRSKQTSASIRTRRKGRELDHSSDCGESFLYLVDVDSDDDVESLALSPVGPWVVDDFSVAPETPRSPVSTCFSVSSLGSEDLDNNSGEWSNELAAKSPRSRLLYFSACADNSETSRCTTPEFQHQSLRRSATSRSSLGTRTSLESRTVKLKRCASAHVSTRGKIRPSSSSTTSRVNPVKRPQSGGTRSYRSSQSDESTR
ncbi:hypothetical protein JG687_00007901 [Phytophthora cactorum]|uniref:Uncharacterized protein n=1 Tax=Phytophthora cactorum TaxID=29920 RepID=A0A329RY35_9STRA|nr:hypothetical protein Pcac1_g15875 [Phytophthora cactorum]KAG2829578.1 hypothetical protein PC112_g8057 [Phytophthora cactorum]KAG2829770.1 hypothetical protein PC111_g7621 [Phytophthora cactorum]KAG2859259.1 hypothetical protein PC113_g9089 [Phytophthora cactorum]KAG2911205.1 hypothetical protein PC114_g9462 [Phytophthora cactorum]